MFGPQKIRYAIECLVIDEDGPKQRLLRLDAVRRCSDRVGEGRVHAAPPSRGTKFGGHSLSNSQPVRSFVVVPVRMNLRYPATRGAEEYASFGWLTPS